MNSNKILLIVFSSIASLFLLSCTKNEEMSLSGSAFLKVHITSARFDEPTDSKLATLSSSLSSEKVIIPWDKDNDLVVNIISAKSNKDKLASTYSYKQTDTTTLPKGTPYRMLVFDSKNQFVLSKDYIVGSERAADILLSTTEKYSFIVYSFGLQYNLPDLALKKGDSIEKATLKLQSNEDVMLSTLFSVELNEGDNNLGFVLKHVFNALTLNINSSNVGKIESIGELSVSNTYNNVEIALHKNSLYPGNIIFNDLQKSTRLQAFKIAGDKLSATSESSLIYTDGIQNNIITLSHLSINGVEKENIMLYDYVAKPGVFYSIELTLKEKTADTNKKPNSDGFNDGTVIWASGNLIKIGEDQYAFASSQGDYGDYWYRDKDGKVFSNPLNLEDKTNSVGVKLNDICSKVGEGWRLPTQEDVLRLEQFSKWHENPSNKYFGTYTMPDKREVVGVYFGTSSRPAIQDQDKYLFLPAAGAYNSGNEQEIGVSCFYWHSGLGQGQEGTSYQIASTYISPRNNGGLDLSRANSLRCVKSFK